MNKTYFLMAAFGALSLQAHAERLPVDTTAQLKLGLNLSHSNDAYKSDSALAVAPHGFYDNHRWYIEGGEAGYYPYKDNQHHARLGIAYDGTSFDPDDAHLDIKGLDERKASVMAHASYMYVSPIGGFKAKIATDALSRHDGTVVTLSHISRFKKDKFTIYPSFGVAWQDKHYNNYYYGVSAGESVRTGVSEYKAGDGISPFASVMVNYDMNDRISVFANQRIEWLSSAQKDSPMTDDKLASTTRLGVSYQF